MKYSLYLIPNTQNTTRTERDIVGIILKIRKHTSASVYFRIFKIIPTILSPNEEIFSNNWKNLSHKWKNLSHKIWSFPRASTVKFNFVPRKENFAPCRELLLNRLSIFPCYCYIKESDRVFVYVLLIYSYIVRFVRMFFMFMFILFII